MSNSKAEYCNGCGRATVRTFVDPLTLRGYCKDCASNSKTSSTRAYYALVSELLPLNLGERVECRLGSRFDGIGTIIEWSTRPEEGGSEVNPVYLVEFEDDGPTQWYTGACLTRPKK